jgi:hypothetical protein
MKQDFKNGNSKALLKRKQNEIGKGETGLVAAVVDLVPTRNCTSRAIADRKLLDFQMAVANARYCRCRSSFNRTIHNLQLCLLSQHCIATTKLKEVKKHNKKKGNRKKYRIGNQESSKRCFSSVQ